MNQRLKRVGMAMILNYDDLDPELDPERVKAVSTEILKAIKANYKLEPVSPMRVFEALNALAGALALVLMGCDGPDGRAREFFDEALEVNLKLLKEHISGK